MKRKLLKSFKQYTLEAFVIRPILSISRKLELQIHEQQALVIELLRILVSWKPNNKLSKSVFLLAKISALVVWYDTEH